MAIQTEALDAFRHRIARDEKRGMRTDVVVYASQAMLARISQNLSLEQAMNVATLPGIAGPSLAMPDIHQGYGFPIGGVAATSWEHGGVGFDINCGVRGAATSLTESEVRPKLRELVNQVFREDCTRWRRYSNWEWLKCTLMYTYVHQ
jgi:tRNA-splicing ligase RtcB